MRRSRSLPALRAAPSIERFPALLAFLLLVFPKLWPRHLRGSLIDSSSRAGLNTEDTFTAMNLDGNAFPLGSSSNLVTLADAITFLFARDLHRRAFPQLVKDRFPIKVTGLLQNI